MFKKVKKLKQVMAKRKRLLRWVSLLRENRRLRREYLALIRSISDVLQVGGDILRVAKEVKTSEEAMLARAQANAAQNNALEQYKIFCDYEVLELKRAAIGEIVSASLRVIMNLDERSNKIPWMYYDFPNQTLYQSPASMAFFKVDDKSAARFNLRGLLENIAADGRRAIEESLKSGEGLRHYKVFTSENLEQPSRELFLSTYPFYAPVMGGRYPKAVGSAIFLYDPENAFSYKRVRVSRFASVVEKTANKCLEQLASNRLYSLSPYSSLLLNDEGTLNPPPDTEQAH